MSALFSRQNYKIFLNDFCNTQKAILTTQKRKKKKKKKKQETFDRFPVRCTCYKAEIIQFSLIIHSKNLNLHFRHRRMIIT